MLIKLFIDDTFPFAQVTGAATITWIIEDHKPLGNRDNISALMRGINFPRRTDQGEFPGSTFVHISGRVVDMNKTAPENHISAGNVLSVSLTKPMAAHTPRSHRVQSQASGNDENDDDDGGGSDGGNSEQGGDAASDGRQSPRGERTLSRKSSNRSNGSSNNTNEEQYTAADVNWFPFIVSSGKIVIGKLPPPGSVNSDGEPTSPRPGADDGSASAAAAAAAPASPRTSSLMKDNNKGPRHVPAPFSANRITSIRVISAHEEPDVDEPEPRTIDLCPPCAKIVGSQLQLNNSALVASNVVHVDKHYRPMMVDQEKVEMWLEKLSTGTFARFQRRWFVITEKSMDYHETQPTVDQRSEKSRGHVLDENGKCMIKQVVEKPKRGEFPSVEDSGAGKYFFVVELHNKPKPQVLYAYTEEERAHACAFLSKIKRRAEQQGGSKRDPVLWKQWANSLLVSSSNLAETREQKAEEARALELECKELQRQIDGLSAGRGDTKAQLLYNRGLVERLEREAVTAHRKNADLDRTAREIREAVEVRRTELEHTLGKSEDMSHRARIIEQESLNEKKRAIVQLAEIRDENSRLAVKIDELFSKWRRVEEHHVEQAFRPSTLSPADIAARAARDYERRSGIVAGGNGTPGRGGGAVGPMAPLTAETFTPRKSAAGSAGAGSSTSGAATSTSAAAGGGGSVLPMSPDAISQQQSGSTPLRIKGSTLSSPNARLQTAVKETLRGGSSAAMDPALQGQTLKDVAKTGRITFGLSAALGFVPGSPEALSSSRRSRR